MNRLPLHVAVYVLCWLIAGCVSLGLAQPRDMTDRIAYANGKITGLANSTRTALAAGRIGSDDARYVSNVAKESAAFVDAAEVAVTAGDTATAEGRLQLATTILTSLEAYLAKERK